MIPLLSSLSRQLAGCLRTAGGEKGFGGGSTGARRRLQLKNGFRKWFIYWPTGWVNGWLTEWVAGWPASWLTEWITDRLADWLADFCLSQRSRMTHRGLTLSYGETFRKQTGLWSNLPGEIILLFSSLPSLLFSSLLFSSLWSPGKASKTPFKFLFRWHNVLNLAHWIEVTKLCMRTIYFFVLWIWYFGLSNS